MKRYLTPILCAALCATVATIAAAPASAGPGPGNAGSGEPDARVSHLIEQVQYRGRGYRGGRSGGNFGRNAAIGIGAAIIGGIVLSEAARAEHRQSHGSDWERCAQTYRSFEPSTGLYTGYDGVRRTCPYLN